MKIAYEACRRKVSILELLIDAILKTQRRAGANPIDGQPSDFSQYILASVRVGGMSKMIKGSVRLQALKAKLR
jgi:hypothetical protein